MALGHGIRPSTRVTRTATAAYAVALLCASMLLATAANAQHFRRFPDFRFISGLPGGGYGVTPEGAPGFNGATQISIPVAYTPSGRSYIVGAHVGQLTEDFQLDFRGDDVNGNVTFAVGLGSPGKSWYLADMETSDAWESSYNVQKQLVGERGKTPAVAVGIIDLLSVREDGPGQTDAGARSAFVVATKDIGRANHPTYLTGGFGTGRFHNRLFGGLSHRLDERVSTMIEYDGYSTNVGATFSLLAHPAKQRCGLTLLLGYVDITDRTQFLSGVTYTFSTHRRPSAESARGGESEPKVRVIKRGPIKREKLSTPRVR